VGYETLEMEQLERSELAVHMTKTQLRGYSRLFALGDASETEGDLISVAYTAGDAESRFDGFGTG